MKKGNIRKFTKIEKFTLHEILEILFCLENNLNLNKIEIV